MEGGRWCRGIGDKLDWVTLFVSYSFASLVIDRVVQIPVINGVWRRRKINSRWESKLVLSGKTCIYTHPQVRLHPRLLRKLTAILAQLLRVAFPESGEIPDEWRKALIFKKHQKTKSGELQAIGFHFVSGKIIKSLYITSLGIWGRRRSWLSC